MIKNETEMLKGDALLTKIAEMREDAANTNSAIALACGYVKENGKPDFIAFYTEMLDAKGILNNDEDEDEEVNQFRARLNDQYGEDAVDAFVELHGEDYIEHFEDAYQGEWESGAKFAQNLVEDCFHHDLPYFVEIDWEATWQNLSYDYTEENGFFFSNNW